MGDKNSEKNNDKNGKTDYGKAEYYYNRELSWLAFNNRVLDEAKDRDIPLFERIKFLGITASNLDEFFMVRVASLKDMVNAGYTKKDIAGMTPAEQLEGINRSTHELVGMQYSVYNKSLLPLLAQNGLMVVESHEELTKKDCAFVDRYFQDNVYPVLTPMAVDSSRPFPLIRNKSLNLGALVSRKEVKGRRHLFNKKSVHGKEVEFATVQVPSVLPRIVQLPEAEDGTRRVILLEQIIERNMDKLFLNYNIECSFPFRIMRNADFSLEEEETEDLLKEIEKQLKKRQWGQAIRLEVEKGIEKRLLDIIKKELMIDERDIYNIPGPLDLTFLMKMYGLEGFGHLKNKPYVPQPVPEIEAEDDIFEKIREQDILLHHPYQTFAPVVDFIKQAAKDPQVLAIKQTLYRVSGNSPIIAALAQAAENGKQVSVLVELKARFDEENNIVWAKKLEKAGCHVIYGLVGLKTHCKITLVVRREEEGIRRYVHLGTGNYNDATAKLYTDLGILTCNEAIGEDATAVFNMLSGYSEPLGWNHLALAPLWLKDRFLYLINREKENAIEKRPAKIVAKMNSLCDPDIIKALYEAAAKGVKIQLIVRGICCLRTGIEGTNDNIEVRSIVGNFLEHARIFYFENAGNPELYMASADWMPRNLERRVEILFPVLHDELKEKVWHVLEVQLNDTQKAHFLQADGSYHKAETKGKNTCNAQEVFCKEYMALTARKEKAAQQARTFRPEYSQTIQN
ncbi:MAG: RNA degradosome polyphosphate kinase [Lachnospiraceae bacterium]|nr:RNA degradosome polyphosphate kinase [Lachnospiraceae bacterium]